jgi:hypothetical protein
MSAADVGVDDLAPQFRRHVGPDAPEKLKRMAAKGVIPMPPAEQIKVLYLLSQDEAEEIATTARETAGGLPDRILSATLRGVLEFLAGALAGKAQYEELILLNPATSDATFVHLAEHVGEKLLEIVADNQLRLLREPDIIRALHRNPTISQGTLDRVVDFAVRSGLNLKDLPSFAEARRRILGDAADEEPEAEATAEGIIEAHQSELGEESETELADDRRMSLTQQILNMTIAEKIKLASMGNKEARTILLRDSNKLVQEAAVHSPRITEGEVVGLSNSRTLPDNVLRLILSNREWMKNYQVKSNLVQNPKTPLPTAMRLLPYLRVTELKSISRNRNLPQALATQAKNLLEKKTSGRG